MCKKEKLSIERKCVVDQHDLKKSVTFLKLIFVSVLKAITNC